MHERKRKKDLQKGIWKGQEIKKIDLSLEEKKKCLMSEYRSLTQSKAGREGIKHFISIVVSLGHKVEEEFSDVWKITNQ